MISVYVSLKDVPQGGQRAHAHGLLAECLRSAGADYVFERTPLVLGERGKPALADRPDIHYNLSHAKGVCACLADVSECGIDCECVREYRPRVAQRVFSAEEHAALAAEDGSARDMYFFRLWTLKEAYVKALGVGIGYPMETVSFSFDGDRIVSSVAGHRFAQFIINGAAIVSVCTEADIEQRVTRLDTRDEKIIIDV